MDGLFYIMNNQLIYTVTQINNFSADILKKELSNIWIAGEISSLKKYPSGYVYITLKDANSELSCIASHQISLELEIGMEVTVYGSINIYTIKGNYQFRISSIFLKGNGDLWLKYNQLKEKLSKEGLFDIKYKKNIPRFSQSIGIITSKEGSVLSDIRNIINRRSPYVKLYLLDSRVSGKNAVNSLCDSINQINALDYIDVIIIARGGGSIEDLSIFNDEKLVREIFKLKIPIISAIGHETDFTLCDFVSDLRASTPSEAAELCCISSKELTDKINYTYDKIYSKTESLINSKKIILSNFSSIISNQIKSDSIVNRNNKVNFLFNLIYRSIFNKSIFLSNLIKSNEQVFKKYDDSQIKKMGYSLLRKNNIIISNINKLHKKDKIEIDMFNGTIKANIEDVIKYDKK